MRREPVEKVVVRLEPQIRGWFARRVASPEDCDDLVQDSLCAILSSYHRFRGRSTVRTWAFAICRNVLAAYGRKRRRAPCELENEPPADPEGNSPRPDRLEMLALEMAADSLPPRLRSVYELYYREDMPVKGIASFLGRPEGTVKYQLSEIRLRLRWALT